MDQRERLVVQGGVEYHLTTRTRRLVDLPSSLAAQVIVRALDPPLQFSASNPTVNVQRIKDLPNIPFADPDNPVCIRSEGRRNHVRLN